jgi:MoxR-like ATPase
MTALRHARPATVGAPPWGILLNKKDAKLAGSHIAKGATVEPANRSRYNGDAGETTLGLGYVEAVLAVLFGIVGVITYDHAGRLGRVTMRSSGGPTAYHFAWRIEDGRVLIGGFDHSDGQATYQAAVVALCQLVVQHRAMPSAQTEELVHRWYALVTTMESTNPRANHDAGWSRADIGAACANPHIRAHIERVCDSLSYAMRYHLPSLAHGAPVPPLVERGVLVQSADPLDASEGNSTPLPGAILIHPDAAGLTPTAGAPMLPPVLAPPSASDTADGTAPLAPPAPRARKGAAARAAASASSTPDTNPPDEPSLPRARASAPPTPFRGGNATRVERALEVAHGPLFLVGPTATGKTSLAIRAAEQLGMGIELFACDPGMDAQEPFGGYARRTSSSREGDLRKAFASELGPEPSSGDRTIPTRLPAWAQELFDHIAAVASESQALLHATHTRLADLEARAAGAQSDWEAIDGPVTRWARRALAGERVLLIIDELARAHESCVSAVMRVMNTYDRQTVEKQGLSIPDDMVGEHTFHIVDVWMTRERLIIPASRVKIIATANLGDRYLGLDLSDPAFRRRWTGGWLHLGGYDTPTLGQILADRLGLPAGATLIAKLVAVATLVEQYQRSEDKLLATLDLATLLTWGELIVRLHAGGMAVRAAWETAAADVWIERICPQRGAELDLDVRTKLVSFVSANAPSSIR